MSKSKASSKHPRTSSVRELLRCAPGPVHIGDLDAGAAPGYPGKGKQDAADLTEALGPEISDLQERLYANGREDPRSPRILLILQGMDTSGKGGVIRHSVGLVDPQGVQLRAFKAPTEDERAHDFLWRIRNALPAAGMIGVFDRSHYEDVLIVRVNELVPVPEWSQRYDQINQFEQEVADSGTRIIKCFLNVSFGEQRKRLSERLASPEKYWKYNPGDIDVREQWGAYMEAYGDALQRCNPDHAPWYVIPSDRKWYRDWAVAQLLLEELRDLDLGWPPADFDVAAEKVRLAQS